jgi:hypothetical protein
MQSQSSSSYVENSASESHYKPTESNPSLYARLFTHLCLVYQVVSSMRFSN